MKTFVATLATLVLLAGAALADQNVDGYYRSNGTYVQPYTRSTPDSSYNNNYNVQPNYNPNNYDRGTQRPTYTDRSPEYNKKNYGDTMQLPSYEQKQRRKW